MTTERNAGQNHDPMMPEHEQQTETVESLLRDGRIAAGIPLDTLNMIRVHESWKNRGGVADLAERLRASDDAVQIYLGGMRGMRQKQNHDVIRWARYLRAVDRYMPEGVPEGYYAMTTGGKRKKSPPVLLGHKDIPDKQWLLPGLYGDSIPAVLSTAVQTGNMGPLQITPLAGLETRLKTEQEFYRRYYGISTIVTDRTEQQSDQFAQYREKGIAFWNEMPEGRLNLQKISALLSVTKFYEYVGTEPVSLAALNEHLQIVMGIYQQDVLEKNRDEHRWFLRYYLTEPHLSQDRLAKNDNRTHQQVSQKILLIERKMRHQVEMIIKKPVLRATVFPKSAHPSSDADTSYQVQQKITIASDAMAPDDVIVRRHPSHDMVSVLRMQSVPLAAILAHPEYYQGISAAIVSGPNGEKTVTVLPSVQIED